MWHTTASSNDSGVTNINFSQYQFDNGINGTIFLDGLLTGSYDLKISTPSGVTFVQDVFYLNPQPTITDFPNQIVYGSNSSFTIDISGANTMWTGNDFIDSTLSIALVDTDTIYYATSFSVVDEDSIAYATFPTTLPLNDYQLKIINPRI